MKRVPFLSHFEEKIPSCELLDFSDEKTKTMQKVLVDIRSKYVGKQWHNIKIPDSQLYELVRLLKETTDDTTKASEKAFELLKLYGIEYKNSEVIRKKYNAEHKKRIIKKRTLK